MTSEKLLLFAMGMALMYFFIGSSSLLYSRKDRLRIVTGFILAFWCFQYLKNAIYMISPLGHPFDVVEWRKVVAIDLLGMPTCLFVAKEVIRPGWVNLKNVLMHEMPFVIIVVVFITAETLFIDWLIFAFCIGYVVFNVTHVIIEATRYRRILREEYSCTDNLDIKWLINMMIFFFGMTSLRLYASMAATHAMIAMYSIGSVFYWMSLCYYLVKQARAIEVYKVQGSLVNIDDERDEAFIDHKEYPFVDSFERVLEEEKLYLNPKLTLTDLAEALDTNRTYLSGYINNVLHTNFYDLVSRYRLKRAAQLISEGDKSMHDVALESGFNSVSTFRRAFIKKYDCTPSDYRSMAVIEK